ncbi:MAG: hypothetical protein FJZ90_00065 [Chloroflexi bacterium]|nr:hypothetical protein [Chloroflexota bacterium]
MSRFIDVQSRVPVALDGDTVYIRAKMDVATKALVDNSIAQWAITDKERDPSLATLNIGSYRLALLIHNIVAWEGPGFEDDIGKPIPCTRINIMRMDPDDPLLKLVAEEIGKRNAPPESPDPNAPTPSGSTDAGSAPSKGR